MNPVRQFAGMKVSDVRNSDDNGGDIDYVKHICNQNENKQKLNRKKRL